MPICGECGKEKTYLLRKDLSPPNGICKACHQKGRRAAKREERGYIAPRIIMRKDISERQPLSSGIHIRATESEMEKLRLLSDEYGISSNSIIRALIRGSS